ncbi:MAG: SPOR domain-containing protein [Gammaproteobacteria bacterium]
MRDYKKGTSNPKRRSKTRPPGVKPGRAFIAGAVSGVALTLIAQHWRQIGEFLIGPPTQVSIAEVAPATQQSGEVEFEFYTRLPSMEVPVDVTQERIRDKKEAGKHIYMLQVGSFEQREDAERLKAQLALLGEIAMIQDVTVNGATMHRVRLGPFNGSRKLDAVRNRLTDEDIPTMALKIRQPD